MRYAIKTTITLALLFTACAPAVVEPSAGASPKISQPEEIEVTCDDFAQCIVDCVDATEEGYYTSENSRQLYLCVTDCEGPSYVPYDIYGVWGTSCAGVIDEDEICGRSPYQCEAIQDAHR